MIKKYEDFIKESHSKTVKLSSEDVSLFTSEPLLQKLVADKKVSLFTLPKCAEKNEGSLPE